MALKKGITKAAILLISATVIIVAYLVLGPARKKISAGNTGLYTVQKSNLTVKVIESGTIKARNAVEIKSEVEGQVDLFGQLQVHVSDVDCGEGRGIGIHGSVDPATDGGRITIRVV